MTAAALLLAASPPQVDAATDPVATAAACGKDRVKTADGCVSARRAHRRIASITRDVMVENDVRAVLLRVNDGKRTVFDKAFGSSMTGVRARNLMQFRAGSMAIPFMTTILLQLHERGRLNLDDPLAKYLSGYPHGDRVTLRMLATNTSGYRDFIQGNPPFAERVDADPFRHWTEDELLATALALPQACDPGACFSYAHTNFIVLGKVIRQVTRRWLRPLMERRIFRPLELEDIHVSREPHLPRPVLHSYTAERGVYEDSTFFSPSWSIGNGLVQSGTVGDFAVAARAVGNGSLLRRKRTLRELTTPTTVGLGGQTADRYYGLGILVANQWLVQNPMINGWTGISAYLPQRGLTIVDAVTAGEAGAKVNKHYASILTNRLVQYLAPGRPLPFGQ